MYIYICMYIYDNGKLVGSTNGRFLRMINDICVL